ncbi:MAG TPA: cbb3-type cytochrome c oxidase subunit 3 [Candidatus Desulfobacillus sp.]|nr:cbb3-type cytochrome c oxidase subunit 3 [Candidatus Desulfobacillus sp.]
MDINDLRSIVTVLSFVTFVGIVLWAWSGRRRQAFDEAANLPFNEEELPDEGGRRRDGKGEGKAS